MTDTVNVTYSYQYNGSVEVLVPAIGKVVQPGEKFESPVIIDHPDFLRIDHGTTKPGKKGN